MNQIDLVEKTVLFGGFNAIMLMFRGIDHTLLQDFLSEDDMQALKLAIQVVESLEEKLYSEIEESVQQ